MKFGRLIYFSKSNQPPNYTRAKSHFRKCRLSDWTNRSLTTRRNGILSIGTLAPIAKRNGIAKSIIASIVGIRAVAATAHKFYVLD